jgi:hypothetical protein
MLPLSPDFFFRKHMREKDIAIPLQSHDLIFEGVIANQW